MRYRFPVTVDLSKFLPEIGKYIESVNETMSDFGFHEKLPSRTAIYSVTITTESPATKAQLEFIRDEFEMNMREKMGDYDLRVEPAEPIL